jgi:hypothetical protein
LRLRKVPEHRIILEDSRHKIYRFSDTPNPQMIEIMAKIGLPPTIKNWVHLGLASAIIIPSAILGMLLVFMELPEFGREILISQIGFIAGLRVLIYRDMDLMERWNIVLFVAVIWCTVLLLILILLSYCSNLSVCLQIFEPLK